MENVGTKKTLVNLKKVKNSDEFAKKWKILIKYRETKKFQKGKS
jgi:hypothetical protein